MTTPSDLTPETLAEWRNQAESTAVEKLNVAFGNGFGAPRHRDGLAQFRAAQYAATQTAKPEAFVKITGGAS